jgi:hypothetical protein
MIKENIVPLGPFPLGVDNVNHTKAKVFDQFGENIPRLVTATNVDIDNDGWIRKRPRVGIVRAGTNILGGWNIDGKFFIQEGSTLYVKTGASEYSLITGLSRRVSICKHADSVYVTDGTIHKMIRGLTVYNWGLSIPTITVTATGSGSTLAAGRYLVQASYSDPFGNEGPVSALTAVNITAGQSISVACTLSSDATYLNIYASKRDQTETTFIAAKAQSALPYVFSTYPNESDPPVTHNMVGPWSNASGIFGFRSWLFMWRDNFVARSEAFEPHLFDPISIFQFADTVNECAPVSDGFFVGTDNGLFFVGDLPGLGSDQNTTGWVPFQKYNKKIYKGSKVLHGSLIPGLQTNEIVALFISEDGLLVGMPDGSIKLLTSGRYDFNIGSRYSIEYDDSSDINKLLVGNNS